MPALIHVLKRPEEKAAKKSQTEEERKNELARLLLKQNTSGAVKPSLEKTGLEYGTCMVFSCLKDCSVDPHTRTEVKECWREEFVLVQWE